MLSTAAIGTIEACICFFSKISGHSFDPFEGAMPSVNKVIVTAKAMRGV